jgi:hypothetical protein
MLDPFLNVDVFWDKKFVPHWMHADEYALVLGLVSDGKRWLVLGSYQCVWNGFAMRIRRIG